jgi:hexosaminidase
VSKEAGAGDRRAVIPKPVAITRGRGAFSLTPATGIVVRSAAPAAMQVAQQLASLLRPATGFRIPVSTSRRLPAASSIVLRLAPGDRSHGDEGYRLRVQPDVVELEAGRAAGLFWGVQTLRQLLPATIEHATRQPGPWRIGAVTVVDRPRFAWRGAMLDVARHFFGVDDVKRFVDLMVLHKLNRLHLHLTDDQGWRISIRSWPRLTTHGGRSAVGGGPGGHYTQRQYREIVAYAARRFVTVVPEIDMPGHTNAALSSYARLTCDGVAPSPYTGIEVGFSSLCIDKELTYRFVDDVVGELAAMTPGGSLHVGGDEALATPPGDYRVFLERVQRIVRSHRMRMVGWEEIGKAPLYRSAVAQHWKDADVTRRAVAQGAKVILSPSTRAYLDMKYAPDTPLGLSWAGHTSVRDAYAWDPATVVAGLTEEDVLGVEAPLWSETASTLADVEYLAHPRLAGIAEIGWSPREGRSWREYRRRLAAHGPRLDALGVRFYRAPEVHWL